MSRLQIKNDRTVSLKNLQPQMNHARAAVHEVCRAFGVDCVVTDGWREIALHPKSLHPHGLALDFRTRDLPDIPAKEEFARAIRDDLGAEYDVVLYDDHLHVEYQPKG